MLITCPNCHASYTVADSALGEKGRQVRCAKCKEVWHATPPLAMVEPVAEEWQPTVDEWQPSTDEWKPSTDEWQPSTEEWQPSLGSPTTTAVLDDTPQIDDAPPVVPDQPAEMEDFAQESEPERPGSREYAEARRRKAARLQAQKDRGLGITAGRVAAALAGVVLVLFFARESLVRQFPQTASLYRYLGLHMNVRGLDFAGLKTSYETQDGTRVLIVEGEIRNISKALQPVANIRYALRNAAGVEVYSWTGVPDRNVIAPGEATPFRTRLASPPNDGRDVRVSFVPLEIAAPQKH